MRSLRYQNKYRSPQALDFAPQRRLWRKEDLKFWVIVRSMRRAGRRVYRGGCHHSVVDGARIPNAELMRWPQRFDRMP